MRPGEHARCEQILRSLPDWFGIEQAIVDYVRDVQAMETWMAEVAGVLGGFLAIRQHTECSAEIHVMAVIAPLHGRGLGRQLVEHAEQILRARSVEFLQVKTLGPSHGDAGYARTRGFYQRVGFSPLEETALWGEGSPCLILVKHLLCSGAAGPAGLGP